MLNGAFVWQQCFSSAGSEMWISVFDPNRNLADVEGLFNLVLIDGPWRDRCVDIGLRHLQVGGYLYLDNVDASTVRTAEPILLNRLPTNATTRYYIDLAPGLAAPPQDCWFTFSRLT